MMLPIPTSPADANKNVIDNNRHEIFVRGEDVARNNTSLDDELSFQPHRDRQLVHRKDSTS